MLFRKLNLDWRYGITELLIVVVGVLIALAADGWLQRVQDRALERDYVERLTRDLQLDTAELGMIIRLTESRARFGETVLSAIDTGNRSVSASDFLRAVEYANYFSYPIYAKATIDDLSSTGNLRLIRSTDVKDALSRYYAEIEWMQQFQELFRPTQLALMQFLPEFMSLEHRYALLQEGISAQCEEERGLSCAGIPWAPPELVVSDNEADRTLERLRTRPEARALYANMARIQGGHYANLTGINRAATGALVVLQQYLEDGW